jgi:hypothetical protein
MSYNKITIISIILTAIFVMPLFSFAEDETVPGMPFQVLQKQIDDLRSISMQATYSTRLPEVIEIPAPDPNEPPPDPVIVMPIDLPAGHYVSTISLSLQYGNTGFDANCWAYYGCYIINFNTGVPFPNMGVGGNVAGILPHSGTDILELGTDTTVALSCEVECTWCHDPQVPDPPLILGAGTWTLMRVDLK